MITRVQTNGSASTGTLDATPPAWASTPKVGSLLVIVGHEVNGTAGTWGTTPAGYTAFSSTPNLYATTLTPAYGLFWKIAGAGEATPGHYGEVTSTQDWVTYTYEFANPYGWIASPPNQAVVTAQSNTPATTIGTGNTGALQNQTQLAMIVSGFNAAVTALSYTNGFVVDRPGTSNGKLWVGWREVNNTDQLSSTVAWTTSVINGSRIATFRAIADGLQYPEQPIADAVSNC
jgi:hypothetical protein